MMIFSSLPAKNRPGLMYAINKYVLCQEHFTTYHACLPWPNGTYSGDVLTN